MHCGRVASHRDPVKLDGFDYVVVVQSVLVVVGRVAIAGNPSMRYLRYLSDL